MAAQDSLDALRELHQDLVDLSNSRLPVIDGLLINLESNIESFRKLLDKPSKNDASRKAVSSGTIEIDGVKYSINADFQEETIQLADGLDLDELESARLLFLGREEAETIDRPALACAVIRFHETRQYLLECLRLVLKQSQDLDCVEELRLAIQQIVSLVLETKDGPARNGSLFARKCVTAMEGCEKWLQALGERVQSAMTLGQTTTPALDEIMEFQQASLNIQHESLGAIVAYLVKGNHTSVEDFHLLLDRMPSIDRWGAVAIHYVPILTSMVSQYGYSEGTASLREARSINAKILEGKDTKPWALPHLQAAMSTWWLAEYSGWYYEQTPGSPVEGVDLEAEAQSRSEAFYQALHDGAFQCTLAISSQGDHNISYDSVKSDLTRILIGDTPALSSDSTHVSTDFRELLMEQFENFASAFISHMPDTLRKFKVEEDDQRRRLLSGLQGNVEQGIPEHERHLERFLLIMCHAYEGRVEAAESFWTDTDSNLYGFLQWASRRQPTPCVSAFCELFRAISTGNDCASAAHRFLMEEGSVTPGRYRRSISLSWSQIYEELEFYASRVREHPVLSLPSTHTGGKPKPVEVDEPESPFMLECYLRLMAHLCSQSEEIRAWILANPAFRIVDTLFALCGSAMTARIRACTYITFRAILTEKSNDLGHHIWVALDHWVSTGFSSTGSGPRNTKNLTTPVSAEGLAFETISSSFEEANAFVVLLQSLVSPSVDGAELNDTLPFPEQLGSSYRMPGVEPYVDLVLGKIYAVVIPQLEDPIHVQLLSSNVLQFVEICLQSFNEDLIIIANKSKTSVEDSIGSSSLLTYARLHPFGRTIEWLFNERVLALLFSNAHQNILDVTKSSSESPLNLMLLRCIKIMVLVMDLQSTYLDIVRPLIKIHSSGRRQPVLNPSLTCFEDSVSNNLQLIVDLGSYCGAGDAELTLASLALLEKLSTSRKLNAARPSKIASLSPVNRSVAVLRQNNDAEPITRSLAGLMEINHREITRGQDDSDYQVKSAVLGFLEHSLATSPESPSIAHVLLGFDCVGDSVATANDSLFANRLSLFHAVLRLAVNYPDGVEDTMLTWCLILKEKAVLVLKALWTSSLTSTLTLADMREGGFLFALWLRQIPLEPTTRWNGLSIRDPEFFIDPNSATGLESYLRQRQVLFEYSSTELRLCTLEDTTQQRSQIVSTMFGATLTENGVENHMTIFDVLDFLELDVDDENVPPRLQFLADIDLPVGTEYAPNGAIIRYNLKVIQELIQLHYKKLRRNGQVQDATTDARFWEEAAGLLEYLHGQNNRRALIIARISALKAWVDLAALVLESRDIDNTTRSTFVLQALQITSPKLELYASQTRPEAVILARYAQTLVAQSDEFRNQAVDKQRTGDLANDRLFQLFRIALRAIPNPDGDEILREALYKICFKYLASTASGTDASLHPQNNIRNVKSGGSKLIDVTCDDAYGGEGTCRVAAVLLLDALTRLATRESSNYLIESLMRTNFISVLVESINDITEELRETPTSDIDLVLAYYESKFSLLLSVSQTRLGASIVMNSGLYSAIRRSGLFSIDLDLGLEIDNPKAVQRYHQLLLAVLRIIASIVISCGQQNAQAMEQARVFLTEYRPLMVATFKREANIGGFRNEDVGEYRPLDEVVEYFVLLTTLTDFLHYEEMQDSQQPRRKGFS
ncbi:hypothetical protein MMC30_004527 [Trapelia coarctata]|nr:hypothetical protein [Trapelia coarctata]